MQTSNTQNGDFNHSDHKFIYIVVLLTVHLFNCNVTEVPCEQRTDVTII